MAMLILVRLVVLTSLLLLPAMSEAADRILDCATGSINAFLPRLRPGDTLIVSGTCNENVNIRAEINRITLNGQGTATINGILASSNTILIAGKRITITGFTITGGSRGIQVSRGSEAIINGNTIQSTGGEGIQVFNGSIAQILNNTIQNNPGDGITITGTSIADIGITAGTQTVPDTNTIQNNAGDGISVNRGSSARIKGNTISGNTGSGILVNDNSTTDTASNTIDGNGNNGIFSLRNSSVRLGRDGGTTLQDAPNSTTVNNTGDGVRCSINGSVDGQVGTLNGTVAAAEFFASCTNSTIP